jgi:hypothetical protein
MVEERQHEIVICARDGYRSVHAHDGSFGWHVLNLHDVSLF